MNNKRNKRGPVRTQKHRTIAVDGAYGNTHFLVAAAAQIGNPVRVKTKAEDVYDGILRTFSQQFDVALEVATLIEENEPPTSTGDSASLVEKLVFNARDIVTLSFTDVDITYAFKDTFQTDSAISARLNGAGREERELEPWDGEMNGGDSAPLELDSSANGWDANDMFKKNELEYGVTSTFDHSLRGYTVPLQHSDSPDYKEAEAKANQIANEIESKPSHKARLELENGDEEAVYAAVVRPSETANGKYIPPAKRKNQKAPRSSPPPSAENVKNGNVAPVAAAPKPAQTQTTPPPQTNQQQQLASQQQQQTQLAVLQPNTQHQVQMATQSAPAPAAQHQPRQNHGYANRQKGHMNGESKAQRGPRNVYQSMPPPAPHGVVQSTYQEMPPSKMADMNHNGNHGNRHHREDVKELQQFAQDFQLGQKEPQQGPQQPQAIPEQPVVPQQAPPQAAATLKPQPEVAQPQPSPSPQADGGAVDKITTALKKSTLNPNAKEFVLNPTAKPFMPSFNSRTPSASSLSRPHTPQTPSHPQYISTTMNGPMQQPQASMLVQMSYMMAGQPQYPQQPQGNRMRKNGPYQFFRHGQVPTGQMRGGDCLSQMSPMQVAAATGQPLLAPAPMGPFMYQPTGLGPAYHQMHGVRMYEPSQVQYLPPQAAGAGPQPGQPQQPPPQYQTAPPQQYQAAPPPQGGVQTHQYVPMCNLIPQSHLMPGMQYLPPPPPPQHPIPLIIHNQQHQVHQGPA